MTINIRKYRQTDRQAIIKLYDDFQDYLVTMDPIKRLRRLSGYGKITLQKTLSDVRKKNGIFFVALDKEEVIGFVVCVVLKQKPAELYECIPSTIGRITDLYVHKKYRNQGIGHLLVTKTELHCKRYGCDVVRIEVFEPNTNAHNFYQSLGYTDRQRDMIKKI